MFILVNPITNVLVKISEKCTPISIVNGNRVECSDTDATAYYFEEENTIYPKGLPVKMYEVDEIPNGVIPAKYLYTVAGGFVENPNYEPPVNPTEVQENINEELMQKAEKNAADIEYLAMMLDIEL